MNNYTLSILVANASGVLTRIAALFSRRGYNIESLTVSPTLDPAVSRMTVVASVSDDQVLEQIVKQLNKLVEVYKIIEPELGSIDRQLLLLKVSCNPTTRSAIIEILNLFRAHAVDVGAESITAEVTGDSAKLRAITELLVPYGIIEMATSGHVAMARGAKGMAVPRR